MASCRKLSSFAKMIKMNKVYDNVHEGTLSISFNSDVAQVTYKKDGDIYDLVHTDIPDEYQGQGLGSLFAEKVFDYLIERNKRIKLTCEFLGHFYSKNVDKYKDYVLGEDDC